MSSGNLTADRRFAYAQDMRRDGDSAAAADLILQALELVPAWAEGQFTLAETWAEAGQRDQAAAAYRAYLEIDPADSMGAAARLHLLGEAATPDVLPHAYVRRLFDEYAARFDDALVGKLLYRAPTLLRAGIDSAAASRSFSRTFDLGCGTGLAGMAVREKTRWLGGVDLSPAMIKEAAHKGIYDHLEAGDMTAALHALAPCDLILAADVLVYVGDLMPVFEAVKARLEPRGLFAFTLQRAGSGRFALGPEHRYSHSRDYVREVAAQGGFNVISLIDAVCRQEKGVDVPGLVGVLQA